MEDDDDDDDLFYASLARLWAYGGCLECSISLRLPGIYLTGRRPFYLWYNILYIQTPSCRIRMKKRVHPFFFKLTYWYEGKTGSNHVIELLKLAARVFPHNFICSYKLPWTTPSRHAVKFSSPSPLAIN